MLHFLSFFEEQPQDQSWIMLVILGLIMVVFIVMSTLSNKKQRKQTEEMLNSLREGAEITTIGGFVGKVDSFDDQFVWIKTGKDGKEECVIKFMRQAIRTVEPLPGTDEAKAYKEQKKAEADDEIR